MMVSCSVLGCDSSMNNNPQNYSFHQHHSYYKKDSNKKAEPEKVVMSTAGVSREQPTKQIETQFTTETNENEGEADKEIDIFSFNEESQEKPDWWSDEIGELRQTFVASRKLLKKERKKASKTPDHLMLDMAYAAYQHDKIVLRAAVNQAKARYEKLGGNSSNIENTTS